ncbi:MAG: diguanylate cyclase [Sulfuricurvum sp.]|nr:diguanylate cyclase [Sulfuricurvum sp.]
MNRLRTKVLVTLSLVILSVTVIITTYNLLHEKEDANLRMAQAYSSVNLTYKETIRDTIHFYTARANANLSTPGVLEAFCARDHEKLYQLMLPRWDVMRKENPSLIVMQFHKADGTSLLRMHQPMVYSDSIATQRSMVAYIHKHHTITSGFEEGIQGLAFRILVPILDHGDYLGAVEFGISTSYIFEKIYRYTHYESFFLIHQKYLGRLSHTNHYLPMGDYMGIDVPAKLLPLVKQYPSRQEFLTNRVVTFKNQSFLISTVPVMNYHDQPMGAIVFVKSVPDFWSHVLQMVIASSLIAITLILIVGVIINKIYTIIANKMHFQEFYNQTILDAIPSPVIVTNGHELTAANQTLLAYLSYETLEDFKRDHECVCEYFEEGDTDEYLLPMQNDQRWTEFIRKHPQISHKAKITIEGKTTIFDVKLSALEFKEDTRYVVIFTDISSMQSIAITDPLTGVANRLHFSMIYEHAINVARREQKSLGGIFFDIDHFKQINDNYGHLSGDEVLKRIPMLIKQRIRKSDILARWGGEEFIILLPNTSLEETAKIAEILRLTIESENFETVGTITCSFGVATLKENESPDELLKRLDELLYVAKESGRNQVIVQS